MDTHTAPISAPISPEKRDALIAAVATSHGTSAAVIVRRIQAVSAALSAGIDVKTLVSEIRDAAAVPGSTMTPVSAATLGQARAVLTFLDRIGVSLPTAVATRKDALVAVYRAAHTSRAGVKGLKAVADAAVNGETAADKLEIGEEAADAAARDERRQGGKGDGTPAADVPAEHVTITDYAAALNVMAGAVATGSYEPDAAFVAALGNLVAEVQRVAAARPVRARVAAPVAA